MKVQSSLSLPSQDYSETMPEALACLSEMNVPQYNTQKLEIHVDNKKVSRSTSPLIKARTRASGGKTMCCH